MVEHSMVAGERQLCIVAPLTTTRVTDVEFVEHINPDPCSGAKVGGPNLGLHDAEIAGATRSSWCEDRTKSRSQPASVSVSVNQVSVSVPANQVSVSVSASIAVSISVCLHDVKIAGVSDNPPRAMLWSLGLGSINSEPCSGA